jgi:stage V sporulation protein B
MNGLSAAARSDFTAFATSHPGAGLESMPLADVANFLFGSYTGLAVTVFNFVPALTASLGVCALPLVSALAAKGRRAQLRSTVESLLRITAVVAVPMGMGLAVMFGAGHAASVRRQPAEAAVAASLLRPLGAAAIFVSVAGPVNSMLQAVAGSTRPCGSCLSAGRSSSPSTSF